jgi:hypothetical protein
VCLDDEDCYSAGGRHLCDVCATDTHTCVSGGPDADGDGWGTCERAADGGLADCDDTNNSINPDGSEVLNLLDDDCDGIIDDGRLRRAGGPNRIDKPTDCGDPCQWSSPRAVYDAPRMAVVWESDEGTNDDLLRVARLDENGDDSDAGVIPLVYRGATEGHNLAEAAIASAADLSVAGAGPFLFAWIDLHGGRSLSFSDFDIEAGVSLGDEEWLDVDPGGSGPRNPVVSASDASYLALAWIGMGATVEEVFLGLVERTSSEWALDPAVGASGVLDVSQGSGVDPDSAPAMVMAGRGIVVAWVDATKGSLRIAYMTDDPPSVTPDEVRDVPLPGIDGGLRDPVLVRSDERLGQELVYLLFCGNPGGRTATEVYALSVDLESFAEGADGDVFGTPLQVSESPGAASIEVAATWASVDGDAIGVAWNDRRDGNSHVYFRRIAALVSQRATSGMLASEEFNLSEGDAEEVPGQGPAVAALGRVSLFGVIWWQRRDASGTDTGDLYLRIVEEVPE